jgi:preprotein translocase subunit SecE
LFDFVLRVGRPYAYVDFVMALNIFKFAQEVRAETSKVTWPSRRETAITTAMVFVMAALSAVFFLVADQLIQFVVTTLLKLGT